MKEVKTVKLKEILKKMTDFNLPFEKISVKQSLVEDIRQNGIKVPIEFITRGDGSLRLQDGVHRLVSAVRLKLKTIPVIIINEKVE